MTAPDYSPARSLLAAARQRPGRPSIAWVGSDEIWTLERSALTVARTVTHLRALGVGEGDRVVIQVANSPWVFLLHLALSWMRAVTVPLSERLPSSASAAILLGLDPRLVIADGPLPVPDSARLLSLEEFTAGALEAEAARDRPLPCGGEIAAIVHTSGSAGRTRGVELSHAALWWGSMCFRDGFEYSPATEVVGVCAPLSHIGGFNGTSLDVFSHGGLLVVFPCFDARRVLEEIEARRITMMFLVPAMCHLLLDANEELRADLSSFVRPLVGGDAMGPALAERMDDAGLRPIHVWGMTETSGAGLMASPDSGAPAGALGAPFPYVDVRLALPDGREAGIDELGEIEVRGPGVARSFVSAGERGPARIRDGWLATGDLATRDAQGWFSMVGRASRMINTGGELVAPARLEELLRGLPGVADAIVFGTPDERWGEIVSALLVPGPSSSPLPEAGGLVRGIDAELAPWERVRRARWVDAIPRNPNGKPDVRSARGIFAAH